MVTAGVIKYSSFALENEKAMVKGDFVITMGKETVITLGSITPQSIKRFIAATLKFGKNKMEVG